MAMASAAGAQDVGALLLMLLLLVLSRKHYYLRGVTYRPTVLPLWKENLWKSAVYVAGLGLLDALLRRTGQALTQLDLPLPPRSARTAALVRLCLLYLPFALWAARGPLSDVGSTRDDRGWSDAATRSRLWTWLSTHVFRHTRVVLSEEWWGLTPDQRAKWYDRHYVIAMHPHGLLPIGAIICGLTWAGGGLCGVTASGAELPEPGDQGSLLHQRWFRRMRLRASVASGACGLFPLFYEMFTKLGCFECTLPFIRAVLREGRDVAIFPGGAEESACAQPGRYVCLISKHKGFVRLALEERLDILPMWTFGDESLMPQMRRPPAAVVALQRWSKECLGLLLPPAFCGLPRFPPLTLVAGVPVSLEDLWPESRGGAISDAAVDEGHRRYRAAQQQLFDLNKALVPGGHAEGTLEFL